MFIYPVNYSCSEGKSMNEEKNTKDKQGFNQYIHDVAFGIVKTIAHEEKQRVALKRTIPREHGGINLEYYNEMVRRLDREHKPVFHARTSMKVIGCTADDKPKVNHTKHLGAFPTVAYHRATNRVQVSGKFVVQPLGKEVRQLLKITPTDTAILNLKLIGELKHKNTSQYKTVWNTRGQRRSKA